MQHSELGHPDGELLVRSLPRVEDEAVTGTVHGLESELGLLDVEQEHVVLVVVVVTGLLPEIDVEHVGGDDFEE